MKTLIHIDDVEVVVDTLIKDDKKAEEFMRALKARLRSEDEKEKKERQPRKKYDLVGLVLDTDPSALEENEVFVFKIEEGRDHNEVPNAARSVIRDYNIAAKQDKQARDLSHGISIVPKSRFKNFKDMTLVDKEPLLLILANNTLKEQ